MNETKEPAPDSPALPIDTDPLASASDLLDAVELSDELSCPALKEQADKLRARAGEAKKEEEEAAR